MITNKSSKIIFLVVLMVFACCCITYALEANDIKARMLQRAPAIQELKTKGVIGENNLGYLELVPGNKGNEQIITDENNDRKAVYAAIAKQQGADIDLVGKRRALKIAENAAPGEWLQDEAGKWYKKNVKE